ncbi:hypothetical protein H7J87_15460 [Mycolicibacterium wolinskyi]|nr:MULTISPECIES: hypothetical protein [Mycolicibacterium]MCV7286725.1 hypothetical protein [Mycolicibacterium wolinskyi]MCV7293705.1 hypothetical protein [Mycolicibacterium goodii]
MMSPLLTFPAVCLAASAVYALVLVGLDRLLTHRSAVRPWARECRLAVAILVAALPGLVRVARSYAATERRIRAEAAR